MRSDFLDTVIFNNVVQMKRFSPRRLIILLLAFATPFLLVVMLAPATPEEVWPVNAAKSAQEVSLTRALDLLRDTKVPHEGVILDGAIYVRETGNLADTPDEVQAQPQTGQSYRALLPFPSDSFITDVLLKTGSPIRIHSNEDYSPTLLDRMIQILPILFLVAFAILLLRRRGLRSLGLNSSYTVVNPSSISETFESVAGIETARSEIEEIVTFLKDPKAASRLGGTMPKGAIFSGPPGTGKTLLARAMAREAGVPFLTIEAAGINQLFVGAGAMKVKRAFREARKLAPCIVFIDEIDAMGRARGSSQSGAGDEKETTLNALLVELDGFDARDGVVVIAATNRPEILDKALTRRGRIDRHIHVDLPDIDGRLEILQVHAARVKTLPTLDLRRVAETTFGFSGADLRSLVNEAALAATRAGRDTVTLEDFSDARDRLLVGLSGKNKRLSECDRRRTARHEAGHAVIAAVLPDADPIEKVTILPQGGALGYVMQAPQEDRSFQTRDELIARIRIAVAGRVAEEIFYGPGGATSGAASDIRAATQIARRMVTEFGMSTLGFVSIDAQDPMLHDIHRSVVSEIRDIISAEMESVREFLDLHKDRLAAIARILEEEETIDGLRIMDAMSDLRGHFPVR